MIFTLLSSLLTVAGALAIIVYATWLLFVRLRSGEKKPQAFGQWMKNVLDALFGL